MSRVIVQAATILVCGAALVCSGMIIAEYLSREKQPPEEVLGRPHVLGRPRGESPPVPQVQFDPTDYTPQRVLDRLAAIVDIPVKPAAEIDKEVLDDELVLGVEVGGQFRAYPINQMTGPSREVFNDVLGETPIAATW